MHRFLFKKEERLCSKRLIDSLFESGSSFVVYPFRVVYRILSEGENVHYPAQVLISVSKKRFKKAVDRNRIKRQVRECYRLNKANHLYICLNQNEVKIIFAIQYITKEVFATEWIDQRMVKMLEKLRDELYKKDFPIS